MNKSNSLELIRVDSLSRSFYNKPVIENLNLSIEMNQHCILFAPSGTGKTTLLRILLGLDREYSGTIQNSLLPREISVVFQRPALLAHRTVQENLEYSARLCKVQKDEQYLQRLHGWIDTCQLQAYLKYFPWQLSAGQKQKVALVRAFLTDPRLVLMDEPFNSIDLASRRVIMRHILKNHPGVTMFMISHNLEDLALLKQCELLVFHKKPLCNYEQIHYSGSRAEISEIFNRLFS